MGKREEAILYLSDLLKGKETLFTVKTDSYSLVHEYNKLHKFSYIVKYATLDELMLNHLLIREKGEAVLIYTSDNYYEDIEIPLSDVLDDLAEDLFLTEEEAKDYLVKEKAKLEAENLEIFEKAKINFKTKAEERLRIIRGKLKK